MSDRPLPDPAAVATPDGFVHVGWMHHCTDPKNCDIGAVNSLIHDEVKRLWLEVRPKQVEHYTVPVFAKTTGAPNV